MTGRRFWVVVRTEACLQMRSPASLVAVLAATGFVILAKSVGRTDTSIFLGYNVGRYVGAYLSLFVLPVLSAALVRDSETGAAELIRVAPIHPLAYCGGKLLASCVTAAALWAASTVLVIAHAGISSIGEVSQAFGLSAFLAVPTLLFVGACLLIVGTAARRALHAYVVGFLLWVLLVMLFPPADLRRAGYFAPLFTVTDRVLSGLYGFGAFRRVLILNRLATLAMSVVLWLSAVLAYWARSDAWWRKTRKAGLVTTLGTALVTVVAACSWLATMPGPNEMREHDARTALADVMSVTGTPLGMSDVGSRWQVYRSQLGESYPEPDVYVIPEHHGKASNIARAVAAASKYIGVYDPPYLVRQVFEIPYLSTSLLVDHSLIVREETVSRFADRALERAILRETVDAWVDTPICGVPEGLQERDVCRENPVLRGVSLYCQWAILGFSKEESLETEIANWAIIMEGLGEGPPVRPRDAYEDRAAAARRERRNRAHSDLARCGAGKAQVSLPELEVAFALWEAGGQEGHDKILRRLTWHLRQEPTGKSQAEALTRESLLEAIMPHEASGTR
ncbi:MAG: ABC transporter permease [Clostridia bacterium]